MEEFDEIMQLYYYPQDNIFVDEGGFPVYSIFHIITPNDLFLFKFHKEYMLVRHAENRRVGVELIYPDDEVDERESEDFLEAIAAEEESFTDYMRKR